MLSFLPPQGWGSSLRQKLCLSVVPNNNIRDGPELSPPLLILPTPPPQEIKVSCPRGSAPSSERIQHTQMQSRSLEGTDALPPAPRPDSRPASSKTPHPTGGLVSSLAEDRPGPRCVGQACAGPEPGQGRRRPGEWALTELEGLLPAGLSLLFPGWVTQGLASTHLLSGPCQL